jgi:hypothetical protein
MSRLLYPGLILLASVLCACGAPADPDPFPGGPVDVDFTILTVAPELKGFAQDAADDLEQKLGLHLTFASNGTIVKVGDPEDEACAVTSVAHKKDLVVGVSMLVAVPPFAGCPIDLVTTLKHEFMHVARAKLTALGAPKNLHSEHGVFRAQWSPLDQDIEETSAALACESGYCTSIDFTDRAAQIQH